MIVVYHDVGGAHSSCVAANIHINKLPIDEVPDKKKVLAMPTFDNLKGKDHGHLIYIGVDEFGAKVFTLSRMYKPDLVIPAISDMYTILNGNSEGIYLVDTSPTVNNYMRIGGFSSRVLGMVGFGRPIVTYGTLKSYKKISKLVESVKQRMQVEIQNKAQHINMQ